MVLQTFIHRLVFEFKAVRGEPVLLMLDALSDKLTELWYRFLMLITEIET